MNRVLNYLSIAVLTVALAACATLYKPTAVATRTVSASIDAWQVWIDAGKATVPQRQQVLAAITKYRAALATAKAATDVYFVSQASGAQFPQASLDALAACSGDLVTLIFSITNPPKGK